MAEENFVGIDISKDKFDAAILMSSGLYLDKVFENNLVGIKSFHKWLEKHTTSAWVCMEATGYYGQALADYLYNKSIAVSVTNPLQIKHFGKACLKRNKNDCVDARLIAQFGQKMRPRLYKPKSSEQRKLNSLMNLLNTLKQQIVQLKLSLASVSDRSVIKLQKKIIAHHEKQAKMVLVELEQLVKKDSQFHHQMTLITSIKGVGNLTAYSTLARIPSIDNFQSAKQFAAFIGVSPKQNQSGKFMGKTTLSCLGDAGLRKVLYMAAISAKRHNPALQPFVQRLTAAGKKPKAIIGAVMDKLARWIFAVLKYNRPFDENFQLALSKK